MRHLHNVLWLHRKKLKNIVQNIASLRIGKHRIVKKKQTSPTPNQACRKLNAGSRGYQALFVWQALFVYQALFVWQALFLGNDWITLEYYRNSKKRKKTANGDILRVSLGTTVHLMPGLVDKFTKVAMFRFIRKRDYKKSTSVWYYTRVCSSWD